MVGGEAWSSASSTHDEPHRFEWRLDSLRGLRSHLIWTCRLLACQLLSASCQMSCGSCSSGWCRRRRLVRRVAAGVGTEAGRCWPRSCSWPPRVVRGPSCHRASVHPDRPRTGGSPSDSARRGRPADPFPPRAPGGAGPASSTPTKPTITASSAPNCGDGRSHTRIARRGTESSTHLGRHRWVIERTVAWLGGFRRLHRRYERKADHFAAFATIAATFICHRRLTK